MCLFAIFNGFFIRNHAHIFRSTSISFEIIRRYRNSLSHLILSLNFEMHALTERNIADGNFKISHELKIKKNPSQYKHLFNSFPVLYLRTERPVLCHSYSTLYSYVFCICLSSSQKSNSFCVARASFLHVLQKQQLIHYVLPLFSGFCQFTCALCDLYLIRFER